MGWNMKGINRKTSVLFISWQPYCSRSDNIAREFQGKSYKIYYGFLGSNYATIFFKYGLQFVRTLLVLFKELPETVFVMSPPVFANVAVWLYCLLKSKKYIVDMHTGAFDPMWKKVRLLQRFFSRNALFSIVTNDDLAEELRRWGVDYVIVPDVPIVFETPKVPTLNENRIVTLVNTFSKDEPIDNFLMAASNIRDAKFFITGRINKNNNHVKNASDNIVFTDFLPDDEYYGLLLASDLIVVLTTRDKTMQRGAYEAIYLGKPVVTSDWKVLRDNFTVGAVFVDNSINGIEEGIKGALENLKRLKIEANFLKARKHDLWRKNHIRISSTIGHRLFG